jgi:signal transduction histidine kinase
MSSNETRTWERVLILAPTANDSSVALDVLRADGIKALSCSSVEELCDLIKEGCSAVVLAEEALKTETAPLLQSIFRNQEAWSDLPVILLTGLNSSRFKDAFSSSGNISILERPFSRANLISAVEVAVRARLKQYLAKQLMEEQRTAATKRDEFLATLSHELRTPLNVILGWTEILLSGDLGPRAQVEAFKILDRNARVQKNLIDDLLDTSRIITGKLYFELKPVSLTQILRSVYTEYLPVTTSHKIKFTMNVPETDYFVVADEARLSQVFTNLITNAIKFTPAGGAIELSLTLRADTLYISVKDTGQGIDPSFIPFVFDRLKQEDMSTTRAHGGLGLGLSIAAHIVDQHHGSIGVSSEGRGKGSCLTVQLPTLDQSKIVSGAPVSAVKPADVLLGVKILVVDDSADIRNLIELWLRKAKADVKIAASGAEALDALASFKPDVLLSDIGMPGMDGYELIKRVRSLEERELRLVPAAALTAYAKDEERARVLSAGYQAHISKPISNDQLITAVSSLLIQTS